MSDSIEKRRQRSTSVDRAAVLKKVMEVLAVKGFAKVSMADLASAAGLARKTLQEALGRREEILQAAIRFCVETEGSLADEPLRVSSTGREAMLSMLEENVRLHEYWPCNCDCLFTKNAFVVPQEDAALQEFLTEKRRALSKQIRARLIQSVTAGELPGNTNCEALANLCFAVLSGLNVRIWDGVPSGVLFQSIEIFIDGLGFRSPGAKSRGTRTRIRRSKEKQ